MPLIRLDFSPIIANLISLLVIRSNHPLQNDLVHIMILTENRIPKQHLYIKPPVFINFFSKSIAPM